MSSWAVFEHLIKNQSGRHRHQGGIIIYVLEGHGRTETDDVILEWKAGDLLLLPIKPKGSSHQHWNLDPSKGCRWVAFRDMLVARTIANAVDQVSEMTNTGGTTAQTGVLKKEWKATVNGDQVPLVTSPDELANVNLFDRLIQLRDIQRTRLAQTTFLIQGLDIQRAFLNCHCRWLAQSIVDFSPACGTIRRNASWITCQALPVATGASHPTTSGVACLVFAPACTYQAMR